MNIRMKLAALAAAAMSAHALGGVGISDFYITDAAGMVFLVDGNTLLATEVVQLTNAGSISEILYLGNGQMMSNVFGVISVHDLSTGVGVEQIRIGDLLGQGIHYPEGLALTSDGDIFMSVGSFTPESSSRYGVIWDRDSNTITQTAEFEGLNGYLDHHEVEPGIMLGADWANSTIRVIDIATGDFLQEYTYDFDPVSFFEFGDTIYTIAKEGDLYTFDPDNGGVDYVGTVIGAGTSIIGATVPAPTPLALLGMGALVTVRRRR